MQKPDSYEETKAKGEYEPVELGGHYLIIKKVIETVSKSSGNPMIIVEFDFAQNDKQNGLMQQRFDDDIQPNKEWPFDGRAYVVTVEDKTNKCSRNFKTFTTSVEKSNPGFSVVWGDGFASCFVGKLVGGVYGIEKDVYKEKDVDRHKFRWFCSTDKVASAKIPKEIETDDYKEFHRKESQESQGTDWMNIPDNIEEELPFN